MIVSKNVSKKFGPFMAVNNLNIHVKEGECFGLLGQNGAGKSTFIGMIYGKVERTTGDLSIFGMDPQKDSRKIKGHLGVVTQNNALDENLTVIENMKIYAHFLGLTKSESEDRIDYLLNYMNLMHKKDALIQTLSGGMKRRLVFVRALLNKPKLLILDEPTTGLDPAIRHLLWEKVQELRALGTTILLTTHYMHEAEVLCSRLVILDKGQVIAEGSPLELIRQHAPGYIGLFKSSDAACIAKSFAIQNDSSGIYVRTNSLADLTKFSEENNIIPIQIRPSNLEDVFLKLTGATLHADA